MFSGITNQFTSLVGAVKGGGPDEELPAGQEAAAAAEAPAPVEQDVNAAAAAGEQPVEGEEGAKRAGSLVDSLLTEATGWLGSAKGWLGSASASIPSMPAMPSMPSMPAMPAMPSIPSIPGLRKGAAGEAVGEDGAVQAGDAAAAGVATAGADDDDKSSATEGADSHPPSGGGTPTGEEGQIGHGKGDEVKITTKVTQQAKHFGSFLSSAINKAGAKIKETVKENPILESFNKEQEAFIKGQSGGADSGVAPWIGHANEAKIKEEILGLSQDRRNFVRAPPAGVDFDFNYDTAYPTAIAIMAEDKALEQMRFELVPKIITEENFWRNYFYRVSLIIQAAELGTLGADGVGQASSGEDVKADKSATSLSKTENDADGSAEIALAAEKASIEKTKSSTDPKNNVSKISESDEFVSDAYQSASEMDLEEIKSGMRKLGIDSMTQQALSSNDEEQWEKDLEAELKDYEVVSEPVAASTSSNRSSKKQQQQRDGSGGSSKRNSKKGTKTTTTTTTKSNSSSSGGGGHGRRSTLANENDDENDDEIPTISNLRTRSTTNNDWEEEYADLIEDTDDLK